MVFEYLISELIVRFLEYTINSDSFGEIFQKQSGYFKGVRKQSLDI